MSQKMNPNQYELANQKAIDYQVPIDEKKFQQVLLNYATNALKYSKNNSKIKVTVYFIQSDKQDNDNGNRLNIEQEER